MKKWMNPEITELEIAETANGNAPSDDFDGPWQQIDGLWYRPGDGDSNKVS